MCLWFWNWAVSEDRKNVEEHDGESLNYHDQIINGNMDTRTLLLRTQKEVRNMLVETRGKGSLVM